MANGDDLKIGGFKDLNLATSGFEAASIGSSPVTLPNSDYNTFRANQANNQKQFGQLIAQHTTSKFNSESFDYSFGTTSGMNPFFQKPATATKTFMA